MTINYKSIYINKLPNIPPSHYSIFPSTGHILEKLNFYVSPLSFLTLT